jgi:hypothetical protein
MVFGTFSGTENGKNVLSTPLKDFGFFARRAEIQFVRLDGQSWPWSSVAMDRTGYFSVMLPPGNYSVNIRMPNRQVYLNHRFHATEGNNAHYIGHINLEITRRYLFLLLCGCGYGDVDKFSVTDELETTLSRTAIDSLTKPNPTVIESMLLPEASGRAPYVDHDCGCLD